MVVAIAAEDFLVDALIQKATFDADATSSVLEDRSDTQPSIRTILKTASSVYPNGF